MSTQRYSVTPHPIDTQLDDVVREYDEFLAARRKLMALRIKRWFEAL